MKFISYLAFRYSKNRNPCVPVFPFSICPGPYLILYHACVPAYRPVKAGIGSQSPLSNGCVAITNRNFCPGVYMDCNIMV